MINAPEKVWMDPDIKFPECEKQYGCDVEYTRTDLHLAIVAAEMEACAEIANEMHKWATSYIPEFEGETDSKRIASSIRALTPTDAQAALEKVKREARNEGIKKVAAHVAVMPEVNAARIYKAILALMEDTDDE